MASSTSSPSLSPYSTVDPQTVQLFARSAQLELLDFVRSMIEQRQLRDPMGGRAKAGDKFMVEVDQFVIGLREPQFEKCEWSSKSRRNLRTSPQCAVPDFLDSLQVAHMIVLEIACT